MSVEDERVHDTNAVAGLDEKALREAWEAFQNSPIDAVNDSDDEQCKAVAFAIKKYLESMSNLRCTICGFVVNTAFAADKPSANFTTRGRR